MSADFWAGYLSGAAGILIGNPLDLLKVRVQAGEANTALERRSLAAQFERPGSLIRGSTAPILGYGALNALLFVSYNRTLLLLDPAISDPTNIIGASLLNIWAAGAVGGLATWIVSAPTELVKCRTQLKGGEQSSWSIAKDIWRQGGVRGLYLGGGVTSVRDSVGYGFYFWSYELSKRWMTGEHESESRAAMKVLLCGGLAGVVTWASIFPLDVIKTRVQTQASSLSLAEQQPLLDPPQQGISGQRHRLGALEIAKQAYRSDGMSVFFRGLGICSLRAFIVNAVQWTMYEWIMRALKPA